MRYVSISNGIIIFLFPSTEFDLRTNFSLKTEHFLICGVGWVGVVVGRRDRYFRFPHTAFSLATNFRWKPSIFCSAPPLTNSASWPPTILLFFFYADHPLQGFRSHCCVRGYSSLLVATAGAEATTRTGRQHTHAHTHTQPPTQPFITSKHDMKSLLVREQVDGSTVLSTKTKYIQGHSTKLLLPEGTMVVNISIMIIHRLDRDSNPDRCGERQTC